jgi:hypothetical protein
MLKTIFAIGIPALALGGLLLMFRAQQHEEEQQQLRRVNTERVIHALSVDAAGRYAEACYLYKGMVHDGVPIEPSYGATFERDCARAAIN